MQNNTQISCPNCGESIDVQDILAHQLEDEIKKKYQEQLAKGKKENDSKLLELQKLQEDQAAVLAKDKAAFEEKKKQENRIFQERLEKQVKEEKIRIESEVKAKLTDENSEQLKALTQELNEKSEKVKELNRSKAEIEKLKREKGELKEAAEADAQKRLNETLLTEKDKIRKSEEERNELRFKEMQKQLEDQKK